MRKSGVGGGSRAPYGSFREKNGGKPFGKKQSPGFRERGKPRGFSRKQGPQVLEKKNTGAQGVSRNTKDETHTGVWIRQLWWGWKAEAWGFDLRPAQDLRNWDFPVAAFWVRGGAGAWPRLSGKKTGGTGGRAGPLIGGNTDDGLARGFWFSLSTLGGHRGRERDVGTVMGVVFLGGNALVLGSGRPTAAKRAPRFRWWTRPGVGWGLPWTKSGGYVGRGVLLLLGAW